MILDADTANEIDDLYAIARVLSEERIDLLGLTAAQWFHRLSPINSVQPSQELNEDMLRLMGRQDIPAPIGSKDAFGMPWGGEEPRDSPAAQFIIATAREFSPGNKLNVVSIGATTNLASAIKLAPDIIPNIRAWMLGFRYQADKGIWNKDEFNIRRDLNAANFLLNTQELELHVMPVSVAETFVFDREDTFRRLTEYEELGDYLEQAWRSRFPTNETWIMWDIALIEAMLNPEHATKKMVDTPPENRDRKVHMYTAIDERALIRDFWDELRATAPPEWRRERRR
jgi:inosine-uridine nucleoside N-ribohydrolase